jgi:hypothetical protein
MEEKKEETVGNYCASCGSPVPPGIVTCPKCSQARIAAKRLVRSSSEESSEHVSVLRSPEGSVRKGVAYGTLSKEQGDLLILLLSRGRLLDFSVRTVLTSLIKDIAEERNAQRREDRIYVLIEFVSVTMPSDDFASGLSRVFKIR